MVHAYDVNTQEAETEWWRVWGQPGVQWDSVSKNKETKILGAQFLGARWGLVIQQAVVGNVRAGTTQATELILLTQVSKPHADLKLPLLQHRPTNIVTL